MSNWAKLRLPEDMTGKSFLDVGCWDGIDCVEAVRRGAKSVVGIDLCTCQGLLDNVTNHKFTFIQMDVFSEKLWELPQFDIVLCAGVLYHVENPLSLIFRLRKTVEELLVLETEVHTDSEDKPTLLLYPTNELAGNHSNWWAPNRNCLHKMLEATGFGEITPVYEFARPGTARYGVHAHAHGYADWRKVLPRLETRMSLFGGGR